MTPHETGGLFLTSAKSIQSYVLATDKLKEMVGGSNIVKQLLTELLPATIEEFRKQGLIKEKSEIIVTTAGKGAIFFTSLNDAHSLAKVWPLLSKQFAPGLEVVQAVVSCSFAEIPEKLIDEGEKRLRSARQFPGALIPEPGPQVVRNARTGKAGVKRVYNENMDHALVRKHEASDGAYKELIRPLLPEEFAHEVNFIQERFPLDFSQIVTKENHYLAVIHIDGNGLGSLLNTVITSSLADSSAESTERLERLKLFFQTIEQIINKALRDALAPIMEREKEISSNDVIYPFRPIVCSGDDITMVLRGQDAIEFTKIFLETFTTLSAEQHEYLGLEPGQSLSACAGIAFVKQAFPFAIAYELSESLCHYAKQETGRKCSALAFHRVSASNSSRYDRVMKEELTSCEDDRFMTMNPYVVSPSEAENCTLPSLTDLLALANTLRLFPASSRRELVHSMYTDRIKTQKAFERMLKIADEQNTGAAGRIKGDLIKLTHSADDPLWNQGVNQQTTPYPDALELLAMDAVQRIYTEEQAGENR